VDLDGEGVLFAFGDGDRVVDGFDGVRVEDAEHAYAGARQRDRAVDVDSVPCVAAAIDPAFAAYRWLRRAARDARAGRWRRGG
jgi:hypothetical protein